MNKSIPILKIVMLMVFSFLGNLQSVNASPSKRVNLDTELRVGYGVLHDSMKHLFRKQILYKMDGVKGCEKYGHADDTRPFEKRYYCGEIPLGEVVNDKWKKITEFDIPGNNLSAEGLQIRLNPAKAGLWMGRPQYQGWMEIPDLDSRQNRHILTNSKFPRDVYIKYSPRTLIENNQEYRTLNMELCGAVPGTYWTIPPFALTGRAKKKVWFFSLASDFTIVVSPGNLIYRYMKVCGELETRVKWGGSPEIKIKHMSDPQLADAQHKGLNAEVYIHNRLINFLMKIFIGQGRLNAMVKKSMQDKIDAVLTEEDLQSGQWLVKLQNEFYQKGDIKESLIRTFETSLNSELAHVNYADLNKYKVELYKLCEGIKLGSNSLQNQIRQECHQMVTSINIELQPFVRKEQDEALGCYDYMASLFSTHSKWWRHKCAHITGLSFEAQLPQIPILQCLRSLQGVVTSSLDESRRSEILNRCQNDLKTLIAKNPKVGRWYSSIRQAIHQLENQFPSEGLLLIPGQWPMKDISALRGSVLRKGIIFKKELLQQLQDQLNQDFDLGPNIKIPAGRYRAALEFLNLEDLVGQVKRLGVIEVWDTERGARLAVRAIWSHQLDQLVVPFELQGDAGKISIKFRWDQEVDTNLRSLHLSKLD